MTGEQGELLPPAIGGVGPLQEATRRTIAAAGLEEIDAAGAASLVVLADVIDRAAHGAKLYPVAPLFQQWVALLAELKLTPASRGGGDPDDAFAKFLAELGDDGTATPARDTSLPRTAH